MEERDVFSYVINDNMTNEDKIEYVYNQIIKGNYSVLPDDAATGLVFKILFEGDLEEDGFERAFLYIPKGVSIKMHQHTDDIELYELVLGTLRVKGKKYKSYRCFIGQKHNINKVDQVTIIETCKITKKYIVELENNEIEKRRSLKYERVNRTRKN